MDALDENSAVGDHHEWGNREKHTLVLNYTLQCPLSCDFCCYGCNPKRREKMDFGLAKEAVIASGDFDDFTSVGFTGGEPLLYPEEVLELTRAANSVGKNSTIATAGHWATSFGAARELLVPLAANGLNRLNVSHDPSHAHFVPFKNIAIIAEAIQGLGIPLYVVSTTYHEEELDAVPDLSDPARGVFHFRKVVAKVGRATKAAATYNTRPDISHFYCYRSIYSDLVVFYDGKAYPCCSTFNRASPGLVLGNMWDEGFARIRLRLLGSLLFRIIKRGSFRQLVNLLEIYDPECASIISDLPADAGACAFCNKIFKDPGLYERVYVAVDRATNDLIDEISSQLTCEPA